MQLPGLPIRVGTKVVIENEQVHSKNQIPKVEDPLIERPDSPGAHISKMVTDFVRNGSCEHSIQLRPIRLIEMHHLPYNGDNQLHRHMHSRIVLPNPDQCVFSRLVHRSHKADLVTALENVILVYADSIDLSALGPGSAHEWDYRYWCVS